jgi:hypothetical protein
LAGNLSTKKSRSEACSVYVEVADSLFCGRDCCVYSVILSSVEMLVVGEETSERMRRSSARKIVGMDKNGQLFAESKGNYKKNSN